MTTEVSAISALIGFLRLSLGWGWVELEQQGNGKTLYYVSCQIVGRGKISIINNLYLFLRRILGNLLILIRWSINTSILPNSVPAHALSGHYIWYSPQLSVCLSSRYGSHVGFLRKLHFLHTRALARCGLYIRSLCVCLSDMEVWWLSDEHLTKLYSIAAVLVTPW
jgi:hypothetical protein